MVYNSGWTCVFAWRASPTKKKKKKSVAAILYGLRRVCTGLIIVYYYYYPHTTVQFRGALPSRRVIYTTHRYRVPTIIFQRSRGSLNTFSTRLFITLVQTRVITCIIIHKTYCQTRFPRAYRYINCTTHTHTVNIINFIDNIAARATCFNNISIYIWIDRISESAAAAALLRGRSAAGGCAARLSGYDLLYTRIGYLTSTRRRAASYVIPLTNCVSERPRASTAVKNRSEYNTHTHTHTH